MATTFRVATSDADLNALATLFTAKVAGVSIFDELVADYGHVLPITLASCRTFLADPRHVIVSAFDTGLVLRGGAFFRHHDDGIGWEIVNIGIDKRLTAAQRITGFHDFVISYLVALAGTEPIFGRVKAGGRLDAWMRPRLPASTRTPPADGV